jgi:thiamine-phosphate diphosphorylase
MKFRISGIYLITESRPDLLQRVRTALQNGVRIVQYRGKGDFEEDLLILACKLRALCREYQALFIVNDDPALALACKADGVHLGQSDGSVTRARDILGDEALIGVSTHSFFEAVRAQHQGADYIGFGCLFPTLSKRDTVSASLEELRRVRAAVTLPIVAIGGIHLGNAALAIRAGADAVAVISAVMQADDCAAAVRDLSKACQGESSESL